MHACICTSHHVHACICTSHHVHACICTSHHVHACVSTSHHIHYICTYVCMFHGVCVDMFLCSVSENTTTSTPYCVFYQLLSLPRSVGWTTLTKWLRYSRVGFWCGWISSLTSCTSLQALEEHKALIDSKASFKNYRDAFGAARPPCIPYM